MGRHGKLKHLRYTGTTFVLALLVVAMSGNTLIAQASKDNEQSTLIARSGDTIAKIAKRTGVDAAELAKRNNLNENSRVRKGTIIYLPDSAPAPASGEVIGKTITLADGYTMQVDEVWHQGTEVWYRKGNVTASLNGEIKSVKPILKPQPAPTPAPQPTAADTQKVLAVWIHLVDGAKFRVDDVQETSDGAWYSRASISSFIEKERIAKIERELPATNRAPTKNRDWTSGNVVIDDLIRTNGNKYGVDPYLVFLVIEKESRFHTRALSPKGAQGLMQLMPWTARRLGVAKPYDPAQNIRGGTQYLRELMDRFDGKVNLVLASYNAGEGAVIKYGRNVPPYRETQDYVKTIGKRYGLAGRQTNSDNDVPQK
jgi:soluble lytic murein transglycosylase-like protein